MHERYRQAADSTLRGDDGLRRAHRLILLRLPAVGQPWLPNLFGVSHTQCSCLLCHASKIPRRTCLRNFRLSPGTSSSLRGSNILSGRAFGHRAGYPQSITLNYTFLGIAASLCQ